jgi:chromate transporter
MSPDSSESLIEIPEPEAKQKITAIPFNSFVKYFLRLGALGWGGPIAVVGYMQRDLVEQREWIDQQDFLDGVALAQILPGPLAAQVAMWVGYLKRGAFGALAVAAAFIFPSFLFVFVMAGFYAHYSGLPWMVSMFDGIMPVVMGIMTITTYKLLKVTDGKDRRAWAISAVVFAVSIATNSEPIYLILGAGILMIFVDARPERGWWRRDPQRRAENRLQRADAKLSDAKLSRTRMPLLASPVLGISTVATGGKLMSLTLFFLKAGAVTFGFGLAIVPVLQSGVLNEHHWLTHDQFLNAIAIGLATPGPAVISATFIGYLVAGPAGAIVSTIAVFTPIYLAIVIPGRLFVRIRNNRQVKAFVLGATAATAGALLGVVIGLTKDLQLNGLQMEIGFGVMTMVTIFLLLRFRKLNELYLIVVAGGFGILTIH